MMTAGCWVLAATVALAAAPPTATIQKPTPLTLSGGVCRIQNDGTLGVNIGPNSPTPKFTLTIGPGDFMAQQMHANLAKFSGPGKYPNVAMAVYVGKTATEDYMGLGTVTINADGKSGTFALNDGKASGSFDCGQLAK
jgi:hypothetical protein